MVVRATQGLDEIIIRLTQIKGDKARSMELTDRELHRILLMARDVSRMTGQIRPDSDDYSLDWD